MKFLGTIALVSGIAGGFFGGRRLIAQDDLAERLPERARPTVRSVRARLLIARQRASTILDEYERGRADAELELTREYYERVGRPIPPDAGPSRTAGT